jgi:hypothetical protein
MTALVAIVVLAVVAALFVLAPLAQRRPAPRDGAAGRSGDGTRPSAGATTTTAQPRGTGAALHPLPSGGGTTERVALEELELDRAMGKLGEQDYQRLRAQVVAAATCAAPDTMGGGSDPAASPVRPPLEDEAEAVIMAQRTAIRRCGACGDRPEPAAAFCSTCGKPIEG